jgi:hypothetical protein
MVGSRSASRRSPLALVALAVAFNLWTLRAEVRDVWYLNDSGIHASMVRWAAQRIRTGHLPFDGWYPYLSLGASRFHHYQSLPHILTGALSVVTGAGTFRWSLYLLLSLWPIAVFAGGMLFDIGPWPAAAAALVSSLVVSSPGLGFEWSSYVWGGSGTWAQLWGMWALPFAWGLSWRAVATGRSIALAAIAVGLTICLHLLVGYLALLTLGVWVLLAPREFVRRLTRAALVAAGALATAAWMLVPLISDARWMTQDEFSRGTFYYDSFGARRILGWLVTGRLFDDGRFPAISLLALAGVVACIVVFGRREFARAIPAAGLLSLLLFFGRPTLGFVIDRLPGGTDLFLRRFVFGVHLAGIYLAGIGGVWLTGRTSALIRRVSWIRPAAAGALAALLAVGVMAPAWAERYAYARRDAWWIARQQAVDRTDGAAFAGLVDVARAKAPGRIFAGSRSASSAPKIGAVPGYAALLNLDADVVGFTRPTWSLMSNVEDRFDPNDPRQVAMFGVRWMILPKGGTPVSRSVRVASMGRWVLWSTGDVGYLSVVDTVSSVAVDRTNLGRRMASFLTSSSAAEGRYPTLAFAGSAAAPPTLRNGEYPTAPPGAVLSQTSDPAIGDFSGHVRLARAAVVLLRSSFDPRWHVLVDGVEARPQMVAPGFVGVRVPQGMHEVRFTYHAYPGYWALFVAGALGLLALVKIERRLKARLVGDVEPFDAC